MVHAVDGAAVAATIGAAVNAVDGGSDGDSGKLVRTAAQLRVLSLVTPGPPDCSSQPQTGAAILSPEAPPPREAAVVRAIQLPCPSRRYRGADNTPPCASLNSRRQSAPPHNSRRSGRRPTSPLRMPL